MLAVDAPNLGNCRNANALNFWHLPIIKTYDKPEYYIGQTVLHKIKVRQGEILHPVTVIGLKWSGVDWVYAVELPEDHPQFEPENHQWDEYEGWLLEPM
jgi:hypothetical protein